MRRCLLPLLVLVATFPGLAAASAGFGSAVAASATAPGASTPAPTAAQLTQQVAKLTKRNARLKTQVANLKNQIGFQIRQNALLSTANRSLTAHNTSLTSEVSTAEQTIGGTGSLPARVAALQALVGVQAVPANPLLFSGTFQQSNASLGADMISQLTVFLQEFNAANFATPGQSHLTFTVGATSPPSLSALFPPAAPADPVTS